MVKFVDRVKMNLTTTGTGTVTFGSVVSGFQSLSDASVVDSDVVRYTIESGTNYESGTGTIGLTGSTYTMARSPSSSSESDNSAINLGSGAVCFLTMLAEDVVQNLADLDNVSSTAPTGGQNLSWDSGSSSWVPSSPSGGITTVGNYAGLPASPSETDLAWVSDQNSLYIYDGAEWDRVFTGSQIAPRFTTSPASSLELNSDGTTSTLTAVAVDDAGFPITYDWDGFSGTNSYNSSSLPPQLTAVAESSGVFTLTPTTNSSNAGSFQFRIKASDGVLAISETTSVNLIFQTPVIVDSLQTHNSATLQATNSGLIQVFLTNSTYSTGSGTLHFPTGTGNTMPTGKRYIEAKITSRTQGDSLHVGIGRYDDAIARNTDVSLDSSTVSRVAFVNFNGGYIAKGSGSGQYSSTTGFSGSPAFDVNDILQIAYDTTAEKVWFGKNNTWATATGDPVTGSGRTLDHSAGGYLFVIGSSTSGNLAYTLQFGGTHTYSTPTGFELY